MRKRKFKYTKPTKVIFCIPGGPFSNNFLKSWTSLLGWCFNNNIEPKIINPQSPVVYYARNMCLGGDVRNGINQKPFNGKVDYDYIMWIDSDMVFTPNDFLTLLNMNLPIASGIYKMKDDFNYATVCDMDDEYYMENGSYKFLNKDNIKDKPETFEVDYTGFGWILFKKGVFEKLQYPWFSPLWKEFEAKNKMKEFTSEDVGICQKLKQVGSKIVVNKNLIIGHEKSCILK